MRSARTVSPVRREHSAAVSPLAGVLVFTMARSLGYDPRSGSSVAMQLVQADVHGSGHVQGFDGPGAADGETPRQGAGLVRQAARLVAEQVAVEVAEARRRHRLARQVETGDPA